MDGDGSTQGVTLEPLSLEEALSSNPIDATLALRKRLDFWLSDSSNGGARQHLAALSPEHVEPALAAHLKTESAVLGVLLSKARFLAIIGNLDVPEGIKIAAADVIRRLECAAQNAPPEAKESEPEPPSRRRQKRMRSASSA
jgi:hypothetical protein